jgi:CubicO group peptidase (beta-lactamase class C family)
MAAPLAFCATAMTQPALLLIAATTALLSSTVQAAPKPCDELKAEIAAKLDEKGVKGYEIAAVDNDKVGDAKVIGSCDGGTKKLTYVRK